MSAGAPGRSCPVSYRYDAATAFRRIDVRVDTLWVAGGLYGNPFALDRLLELYARDAGSKALVFNGDFHWFDVEDFRAIDEAVSRFHATRGNIETELAQPDAGAGCGCAYPEWVDDDTVERSNGIMERLRAAASRFPDALGRLARLPMHLVAEVGGERVAVVHGDAGSLAGWGFSQERLATPAGLAAAHAAFAAADVRVFASSHTCLPVLQAFAGGRILINNGAAGMPNFRGTRCGLATRISVFPGTGFAYRENTAQLFVEALPVEYDAAAWERRFVAQWPHGSDAYRSYHERIVGGPRYRLEQALRRGAALAA